MEQTIGVYHTHQKALTAAELLVKHGFDKNSISIIGKADVVDDELQIKSGEVIQQTEVGIGIIAGSALGILTGVGVIAIPGVGFLYGAGALLGAIVGFDFGLITGGIVALLTTLGIKKEHVKRIHEHLKEGKFLLIVQGTHEEVHRAREILHAHGQHVELDIH
jgi:uncharacterized membrane protein